MSAEASRAGLALPFGGSDAASGLMARAGAELAARDLRSCGFAVGLLVRDTAHHFVNPHEDEGRDDAETPDSAAATVAMLARDGATAVVGGVHPAIAAAMARAARHAHIPFYALDRVPAFAAIEPGFRRRFHARNREMPAPVAFAAYRAIVRAATAHEPAVSRCGVRGRAAFSRAGRADGPA